MSTATMNIDRLYDILRETTVQLRKGPGVEKERVGNVDVTHVYAMPHVSEAKPGLETVDCEFLAIGVDRDRAEQHRAELLTILRAYPEPDRLRGGPSYIEVGAVIGDQGAAFQLFALGEVLGLWMVITPAVMGFSGPEARDLAGRGFVMISGFKDNGADRGNGATA